MRTIVIALSLGLLLVGSALASDAGKMASSVKKSTEAQVKPAYPLDHCIVSGEKLGEMGEAVVKEYDGREVRFCCANCVKTFEKDQAKYMEKLDAAVVAALKPGYPLNTCVVSGEELGGMGEPVDYVYHNQLVRFCCGGCISTFEKNPEKYLGMIGAAASKAPANAPAGK